MADWKKVKVLKYVITTGVIKANINCCIVKGNLSKKRYSYFSSMLFDRHVLEHEERHTTSSSAMTDAEAENMQGRFSISCYQG